MRCCAPPLSTPAGSGAQRAQEYGRLNVGKGMLLVRITPEKVVSENNVTGEQEQATIMSTGRR